MCLVWLGRCLVLYGGAFRATTLHGSPAKLTLHVVQQHAVNCLACSQDFLAVQAVLVDLVRLLVFFSGLLRARKATLTAVL